ncbi:MAG: hypothetical protein ACK54H_04000 [Phycisphaerales bacterium]
MNRDMCGRRAAILLVAAHLTTIGAAVASAQISDENPPVMLQWFETRWTDMERRMPDWFIAGYGSTWLPPVSRGRSNPNTNSTSAGYDVFDRFHLGRPGEETAYGTERGFGAVVDEFHRANGQVFIDMVLNHNAGRDASAGFQTAGGYPGFWMSPQSPMRDKVSTDNWGDFHNGVSGGYYQSENPSGARYCLLKGDLVALVDINHSTNNLFIRQPVTEGNPQNIPAGTVYNKPDPNNARFYPDTALGTDTVNNPGMWYAGPLNTGIFSSPCDVPARNEPATTLTLGRFNTSNPLAGDPVPENATAYLSRWTQWMLDVQKVDGFRIDAIKHMPSWFYDTYFDSVVSNRRRTPDGRFVTPYSFGESVEGNDFTFDRYIRKVNGRTSGRNPAGDAFGNRDALDLNGAGGLRDVVNGFADWTSALGRHLDSTDDGFQNGSVGVNHIFSHDNGTNGDGSAFPSVPGYQSQGWFAHAYLVMRPGQAKVYHHGRGINRTGAGFYPREGQPLALGWDPTAGALNPVLTNLVQLSNWYGRGWYYPRWTDNEVHIFERATPVGSGLSGNVLVACNRSYQGASITSYDGRSFNTAFPQGTRLVELTGNAANPTVDPLNQIADVITVGANGNVTVQVPRNQNINGVTHHKGFVIYGPAVPSGTLSITGASSTLPADNAATPDVRQRLASIPVITGGTFSINLSTTNGDPGAGSNANADDNAVFRIDAGFVDYNGNGSTDYPYTNAVIPGYENFVTQRQPLAGTTNTNGLYSQQINASLLDDGMHYLSVVAFRKRSAGDAPLYREFRQAFYVDRAAPQAALEIPAEIPSSTFTFRVNALDRTVNRVHLIVNPANVADPLTLATFLNQAAREDRFSWTRTVTNLQPGLNRILVIAYEESGRGAASFFNVIQGACPADWNDDGAVDGDDVIAFFTEWDAGNADFNGDGSTDGDDVIGFFGAWDSNC